MITQKDIARRLGVSASLVSRALTGTADDIGAAPATVARIRAEAARLHYRPSAAALSLRGAPTRMVGVVVKDFEDPYFGHMLGELQRLAAAQGYSLAVAGAELTPLLKFQLDGVILVGSDLAPAGLAAFVSHGTPVVQLGWGDARAGVRRVHMDDACGLRLLVEHLRHLGHRDIGYIGTANPAHLRREASLREVLRDVHLVARPRAFGRAAAGGVDAGYAAMRELLRQAGERLPTAVIAADDALAQAALRAIYEQGRRVPADLSLAGVDDLPSARLTIPALTTVRQPVGEMIRRAFACLVAPAGGRRGELVVKPELVVRESCAPPRQEVR